MQQTDLIWDGKEDFPGCLTTVNNSPEGRENILEATEVQHSSERQQGHNMLRHEAEGLAAPHHGRPGGEGSC